MTNTRVVKRGTARGYLVLHPFSGRGYWVSKSGCWGHDIRVRVAAGGGRLELLPGADGCLVQREAPG